MSVKTRIFAYKGNLGANTDIDNGVFFNNPKASGQLGVTIPIEEIEITQEAINLLKNAPKEGGSFAPIMLTKHSDNTASIGLLGFWLHHFNPDEICIGRLCDKSVLDVISPVEFEVPQDYKDFIDNQEAKK